MAFFSSNSRGATLTGYALTVSILITGSLVAINQMQDESGSFLESTGNDIGRARYTHEEVTDLSIPTPPSWAQGYTPPPGPTNLASGQPATASSAFNNTSGAGVAVDANTDGAWQDALTNSVMRTTLETNPWMSVDLGSSSFIEEITIHPRTDCCPEQLSDFYVVISSTPIDTSNVANDINTLIGASSNVYYNAGPAASPTQIPAGVDGQYVYIVVNGTVEMSLAEITISGYAAPTE